MPETVSDIDDEVGVPDSEVSSAQSKSTQLTGDIVSHSSATELAMIDSQVADARTLDRKIPANDVELAPGTDGRDTVAPRGAELGFGYSLQLAKISIPFVISDLMATTIALAIGSGLTVWFNKPANHIGAFIGAAAVAHGICFWLSGLYPGVGCHPARELKQLFRGTVSACLVLMVALLLISTWRSPYLWTIALALPFQFLLLPISRSAVKAFMRKRQIGVPFYFLGKRSEVMRVYRDMSRFGWTMLLPVGRFSDDNENEDLGEDAGPTGTSDFELRFEQRATYLGTPDLIVDSARRDSVYWLFVVGDVSTDYTAGKISAAFPEVIWVRSNRSRACFGNSIVNCGIASGVRVEESLLLPWPRFMKRMMDVCLAAGALLALSPLIALLAILVRVSSRGPIFFSHDRIGRHGTKFKAWKFRSMVANANDVLADYLAKHPELQAEWDRDHKLKDDPRITFIGKILRKSSLDELPQLWNVLVGEMSLVGPRPIVQAEIVKYGETFTDYLRVTPGITGLWQISGRNNTTYAERLAYDEFYVRHWTIWLDAYILMRTVKTVLFCEGAY